MQKVIAIIGSTGMLGIDVNAVLKDENAAIHNFNSINLDITELNNVMNALIKFKPNYIINCAAYTNVDLAETEKDKADKVNHVGALNLAIASKEINARLIHISTDYVFNGLKKAPYNENDDVNPVNEYGLSKLKGENAIKDSKASYIILRTEWLYGKNGKNFVNTILKLADTKKSIEVVDDQFGSPTYTKDVAFAIRDIIANDKGNNGIYNITNAGYASWYEFAAEIIKVFKRTNCVIIPVLSDKFVRPAKRPADSRLDCSKIKLDYKIELRNWKDALKKYCYDIGYFIL
ncbi:MAG: dTDP-4-dehydrorhamnose reductase [Candidatus Acididesulfobacter diazotrophicus]|jgi:dTDP-4-dehydrorhamnose reductase|uniref:dTDP-4-dehydrorhamnose reductase n=1 Tax=Candidatus Acididesulfobacter diazotrophicus TaxID=2597226 RepID=A0A519BQ64_9DELT|nr:MAG: dTDP-4-dehydrorhamnose reductase [Candidatus Acididesulfobacter diazotrophicus]